MKNKWLKKAVSLMLCILMALSLCSSAFAASESVTPVIVVSGMGSFPLFCDESGEEEQVFPPSASGIVSVVGKSLLPLLEAFLKGDLTIFADGSFDTIYEDLFEIVSMDESGKSLHAVYTRTFPGNVGNYPDDFQNSEKIDDEVGMIKAISDKIGEKNTYFFNYDWRMSPLDHADALNAYIEDVKAEQHCSKVILVPASMGGTVVNSYLYRYGSDSVKKIVYCMVASKGLNLVGELFGKNIKITADMLLERMFNFEKDNALVQALVSLLHTGLELTPNAMEKIDAFVENFLNELSDRAYTDIFRKSFASMPGMWAFCPDSYYENDKALLFGENTSGKLIDKIDEYHYTVQNRSEELMKAAEKNGCDIYIISAYGFVGFPATDAAWQQSDCLIETANSSFGAVTAPYGKPFGPDYKAVGTVCADESHNHVSTDGIVDASACAFPEQTWFIKNNRHVGLPYGTGAAELLCYLVFTEDKVTVRSDESYPQFVELNLVSGKLTGLTGNEIRNDKLDEHSNIFIRILSLIEYIVSAIKNLFAAA